MRDNYFEKKLEITKDNLAWTIREIKNAEVQMARAKIIFDDKIKTGNDVIIRLESIQKKAEKNIKHYEDMIKKGYKFIDLRNGKAYKTEKNLEQQLLSERSFRVKPPDDGELSQEAKEIEIQLENRRAEKIKLKVERKARKEAEQRAFEKAKEDTRLELEAQRLRREQSERRLKEAEERARLEEEERLKKEAEILVREEQKRVEEERHIAEMLEQERRLSKQEIKTIVEEVEIPEPEPLIIESEDNELEKAKATKAQINQVSKELGEKIIKEESDKSWIEISAQGQALAKLYNQNEGGHAVWNGIVTKGFKRWCEENNFKIGE